uniref:Putative effector protein Avh341 n=3 Tax=Hyaloperonospora TaxID=184462 RepID=M4BNC3_HYAAE|nr:putative effector protein Avh341 [Hyaloperonospora parasitica]
MRLHYVGPVVAAALAASAHGLQVVSDSASDLQRTDEARQQPYINDKTKRFLTSEDKDLPLLVTSDGYASLLPQGGDNDRVLRSADIGDGDYEEERSKIKKRHKRKSHGHGVLD